MCAYKVGYHPYLVNGLTSSNAQAPRAGATRKVHRPMVEPGLLDPNPGRDVFARSPREPFGPLSSPNGAEREASRPAVGG